VPSITNLELINACLQPSSFIREKVYILEKLGMEVNELTAHQNKEL
jgi:hypothetical protein